MKNILTTLLILLSVVGFAQTKVQIEVENENGKEQYKLKLEREVDGKTVVTKKTYNSMEEMKNDPKLEGVNIGIQEPPTKEGEAQVIIEFDDENGSSKEHKMMFFKDGEEGEEVNIEVTVDEDGTKHIFKNGEEIDMDELEESGEHAMIFISEDGDETNLHKMVEEGHKMMFISDDNEGEGDVKIEVTIDEDGTKHVFKNGEEIDLGELHESGDNVFVFNADGDSAFRIEEQMEVEVTVDEDGNNHVTVNGEEVDYQEWKETQGSNTMVWREEGEDGTKTTKEILIIRGEDGNQKNVKMEVIVQKIALHIEEINKEDEKDFSLEDSKALKLEEFNFYPNPSNGSFNLSFQGKEKAIKIRVTDINGKEMYMEDLQEFSGTYDNEINLTGLKKGIYLLQVVQGSKAVNKKIVIE